MKRDVKALLGSLALVALGMVAFECAVLLRSQPDSPGKVNDLPLPQPGTIRPFFVLTGSVLILAAAMLPFDPHAAAENFRWLHLHSCPSQPPCGESAGCS